ncbi:hypothetical protein [Mesorhizobium sp. B2-7-1]|uniref:hypothetical protein n=1 Tax=Mesorhizobium sp. B2-7-1 TaxID=2589909 RepID=UPI0011267F11|nr:hypothetical protein [Mesorhizobium sp. B2-7-1]TPJ72868.1 hypothetical protein FJ471_05790 [Mesorhizobium sp. B2-7-1]
MSIPANNPIILNDLNVHLEPFHSFGFAYHGQDVLPVEADSARMGHASFAGCRRSWLPTGFAAREEAV